MTEIPVYERIVSVPGIDIDGRHLVDLHFLGDFIPVGHGQVDVPRFIHIIKFVGEVNLAFGVIVMHRILVLVDEIGIAGSKLCRRGHGIRHRMLLALTGAIVILIEADTVYQHLVVLQVGTGLELEGVFRLVVERHFIRLDHQEVVSDELAGDSLRTGRRGHAFVHPVGHDIGAFVELLRLVQLLVTAALDVHERAVEAVGLEFPADDIGADLVVAPLGRTVLHSVAVRILDHPPGDRENEIGGIVIQVRPGHRIGIERPMGIDEIRLAFHPHRFRHHIHGAVGVGNVIRFGHRIIAVRIGLLAAALQPDLDAAELIRAGFVHTRIHPVSECLRQLEVELDLGSTAIQRDTSRRRGDGLVLPVDHGGRGIERHLGCLLRAHDEIRLDLLLREVIFQDCPPEIVHRARSIVIDSGIGNDEGFAGAVTGTAEEKLGNVVIIVHLDEALRGVLGGFFRRTPDRPENGRLIGLARLVEEAVDRVHAVLVQAVEAALRSAGLGLQPGKGWVKLEDDAVVFRLDVLEAGDDRKPRRQIHRHTGHRESENRPREESDYVM